MQLILPVAFILMAVLWIYIGLTKFGFFDKLNGGTPGFLPIICASVMLIACIVEVINILRGGGEEIPKFNWMCAGFFVACGGIVALSYLIGLLPSMIVFVFAWLKFIEKSSWKSSLFVTALNAAIGYGVFQFALGVPFPEGLLFATFFG